ncbi:MAG: hypothetical protein IJB73_03660 [Firmicutes bacterium]|nr:hypothetical protein [Bacillota bacterium]
MIIILRIILILMISSSAASAAEVSYGIKDVIPQGFSASSYSYTKIRCVWDEIEGADGYEVYRAASETGKYKKVYSTDKPQKLYYINTGRTTGRTYYYKMRGYKKINGRTYYTKFSVADSAFACPAKVRISEVYCKDLRDAVIKWNSVKGATGYQLQVNQKKNDAWTGWRSYSYNYAGEKSTFETYRTLLSSAEKKFPDGYIEKVTETDDGREHIRKTVEEYVSDSIGKTEAWLDILQDDSIYKFRVRAYHTEAGKKIYGRWSDEKVLSQTLDPEKIREALKEYTMQYAAENYPAFVYDEQNDGQTDQNSSYYVYGAFPAFSRYARQQDVIEDYKDNIEYYVRNAADGGEMSKGFLYIRLSYPGDREGAGYHLTDDIYYSIWMLR